MRQRNHGYYKKIDFVFYNEDAIRQAIEDERSDCGYTAGRNGSGVGDPTASTAIKHMTPLRLVHFGTFELEWPEHWLNVIAMTKRWAPTDTLIVGIDFYANTPRDVTMAKLTISKTTYYRLLDAFVEHAALIAIQLGLIKIF